MSEETTIHLHPGYFDRHERPLVQHGEFAVSTFRYESGVAAIRLRNAVGELIVLPFHGQQIWRAMFAGQDLTMVSMFDEPRNTREYLHNYGAFLVHCGITGIGAPGPGDHHQLHGELPNAPYQSARLVIGQDTRGSYIGITGSYQHTVAFNTNYVAEPLVRLYAGQSVLRIEMKVTNLRKVPMELMYLAHVNFRPVDQGRLVYSADVSPKTVRVRAELPPHVTASPELIQALQNIQRDPAVHHHMTNALCCDPEIALYIDYLADADGWAHSLQVRPDGSADYIRHRVAELDKGIRWICRTPDQQALGLILPATSEPEGYTAEKAKGNYRTIPPGGTYHCAMDAGLLDQQQTADMQAHIERIIASAK